MQGGEEKKKFDFPKKEDLIEEIKNISDDIEHVSLNLIKCDFNAVEKDVEKAFPDYHFIKVKKYNPGSFEVIFEAKIDAINFIRNCFDKKILTRRFFIKLGRQQKEHAEKWSAVGYVPKQFKQPYKKNAGKPGDQKEEKVEEGKQEHAEGQKKQQKKEQAKPVQQKPHEVKPVEHKKIPEHKPVEHKPIEHKPVQHKPVQHKPVEHKPVQHKPVEHKPAEHKAATKPVEAKQELKIEAKTVKPSEKHEQVKPKVEQKPAPHNKPVEHKPVEHKAPEHKLAEHKPAEHKHAPVHKPAENKAQQKPTEQKPIEPKKEEKKEHEQDDGWIVVPAKKGKNKKK